jgi:hypothetical protein
VYFGTDSTPDSGEYQGNTGSSSWSLPTLAESTTYYWRIDTINACGTTTGAVWSFTTTCDLDTDPPCSSAVYLGSVSGDTGADETGMSSYGEDWYLVEITEDSSLRIYLSAWVALQPDDESDYDLYVYCEGCGGSPAGDSTNGTGELDSVDVRWDDDWGEDDDGYIVIKVSWYSGCGGYELGVYGNVDVDANTCDQ